ncbi:L-serine ammonia-lyase, iron-sulfur-dependent, subunit alpha, partial [Bacillus licheniformis]|uniref:L-serine ammonia-lyase, iron-sulfur-dependent, subunit alpha n=1 Tax=Bacillus licheniformis TaxID=1402 RepID=UPI002E251908|nr:L-serine ammonia-lyase, iron-sulfur-dependent, subunit alpha [Bacillus licheniformis]
MFRNVKELIQLTKEKNVSISEIMITQEIEVTGRTREDIFKQMEANLAVMEDAVQKGIEGVVSHSGLTGGDAVKLQAYLKSGKGLSGAVILDAVSKAVATNEVNAAMGTICATPTAGSAGVVPGTLVAVKEKLHPTKEQMVRFLFTSGACGFVVANNASIS